MDQIRAYRGNEPFVFISYSHDDQKLVYPYISELHAAGFNIYFDEGIRPGTNWRDDLASAIKECSVFVFFATPSSVASTYCVEEINFALAEQCECLTVYLQIAELPLGLRLGLHHRQAIHAENLDRVEATHKIASGIELLLENASQAGNQLLSEIKSIAVLPFANRSSNAEMDYLCDGIADELINGLSRIRNLSISSRMSSFAHKNQNVHVSEIGNQLGVKTVLEGSVQSSGDKLRISIQLINCEQGYQIWSHRYDGVLEDLFDLQDDVCQKVIDALEIELTESESLTSPWGTQNSEAHNSYLLALYECRKGVGTDWAKALNHFENALERDPDFVSCNLEYLAALVNHKNMGGSWEGIKERFERVFQHLKTLNADQNTSQWRKFERILESDGQLEFDIESTERLVRETFFSTTDSGTYLHYGALLARAGLYEASIAYTTRYEEQNPSDHFVKRQLGVLLRLTGRLELASEKLEEAHDLNPSNQEVYVARYYVLNHRGLLAEAEALYKEAVKLMDPSAELLFAHAVWSGETDLARELLELEKTPYLKAVGNLSIGEFDVGIDYLEETRDVSAIIVNCNFTIPFVCSDQINNQLEKNNRYQGFLSSIGLGRDWKSEQVRRANTLTPITRIRVQDVERMS